MIYLHRLFYIWFPSYSPFMFHSFPIYFIFFLRFFFCIPPVFVPHSFSTCSSFVLRFILHLFSICFPLTLCLLFICRHLFYAHFSFLPHLFSIFILSFSPFPFSFLFLSSLPFISFATLSWNQIRFVRGQGSIPFCRVIDFPLEISSKPANGCQGEMQSFPGKTLHVRLGSEIRELRLSK